MGKLTKIIRRKVRKQLRRNAEEFIVECHALPFRSRLSVALCVLLKKRLPAPAPLNQVG